MNHTIFKPKLFNFSKEFFSFFILTLVFCPFILRGSLFAQSVAAPYDILINEFMAKPSATGTLPNSEFIELYNKSSNDFNLKGYKFYNGNKFTVLPSYLLKSHKYVTVYKNDKYSHQIYGDTLALDSLFTLTNPGDVFYLTSSKGEIIDAASYDLTFYQDSKKAAGGYTLERINVKAPCNPLGWAASENMNGGTPGKINSVNIDSSDHQPMELDRYYLKDDKNIVLVFNKSLFRLPFAQNTTFQMLENLTVLPVDTIPPLYQIIQVKLNSALLQKKQYHLIIKDVLKDCQGLNILKKDTLLLQLPEKMVRNDLVVNEILTNPETGGSRFIELYNRSDKSIDIINLKIGDNLANQIKVTTNMLLLPNEYVVFTENPLYIQKRYSAAPFRKRIIKNKLPTWSEKGGLVILSYGEGTNTVVLDSFNYEKSWHNPLIANTEGVSLEKINPNLPSMQASSWQSAAQTVGFASPAQQNSQFLPIDTPTVSSPSKNIFELEKKIFSPDGDGFDDFLRLNYRFDKAGYSASIRIFDDKGRLVKTLINNELLETEGVLKWEGDTDEGLQTRLGIYIIIIESISPKGQVERMKLACVVGGRM